ncbi:glycosyltransferase family 2 protein [Candidatus Saccharibacteria bacterium]|nr:glycosyltransferase family 2 protein [Candidatus Saccharibacteria bacterium]
MKKLISIIIPAYNEEESLPPCFSRLTKLIDGLTSYNFEVLLVDDGSKDCTAKLAKAKHAADKRFHYLSLSRNFGKEIAMMAGMDYSHGDAVIFIDADLQDPPELIPKLIEYWEQGYDDVYAKRRSRRGETWLKKWTSRMYYRVLQSATRVEIQKDTGDFRLLDRRCINALIQMRESSRNSKSMFSWIGYKKKEVLYDRDPRIAGQTKWNYLRLVDLAIDGITSFTTSPLRLATILAIPTFILFVGYFIYVIIKSIVIALPIQAFQAIILLVLFFSGVNILLFGIIGEYLGRIFKESKARPLYFIDEHDGQKETNSLASPKASK